MRRIIRNSATGKYFRKGDWTSESKKAQVFISVQAAVRCAEALKLSNVEVLIQTEAEVPDKRDVCLRICLS
jgi:hypothetical protein